MIKVKGLFNKTKLLAAAVVMTLAVVATGATMVANNNAAKAASSCTQHNDKVNIAYHGIDCGSLSADIAQFKAIYNSNTSGHIDSPTVKHDYHDIQAVYSWAGATSAMVNGMNTSNTALGTMYRDGRIVVNGQTVATDSWVSARFGAGQSGYTTVIPNAVWARKTTTSLAEASAPVLVAYTADGQVAFAGMIDCMNAVKATPVPKPKPVVACTQLVFTKESDTTYQLTGEGSAQNATITGYTFNFGDGQTQTLATSGTSATTPAHTYKPGTYTANVTVNYTANGQNGTISSANCAGSVTIPQPAPVVACEGLTSTNTELAFNFSASASAKNATINSFTFDFGDGSAAKTVNAANNKASVAYSYKAAGTYTANVTVNYTDLNNKHLTTTSSACAIQVKPSTPMCTVPGKENLPPDSPDCHPAPTMSCDLLTITNKGTDTTSLQYNFTVKASATNATIDQYVVDFGDGTPHYQGTTPSIDHSYAKAGTYNIVASAVVTAGGQSQTITSANCAKSVTITIPMCTIPGKTQYPAGDTVDCSTPPVTPPTPPTPPSTPLPNTGPGDTIGLFAGLVVAGAAAHRIMANRRLFGLGN